MTIDFESQRARLERALERLREVIAAVDDEHDRDPKNREHADALRFAANAIEQEVIPCLAGQPR